MLNFKKIKEIREDHDLTQQQMANVLEVSRSTYSLWELGINIIPLKPLCKFSDYFNINIDYILNISNCKDNKDSIGNIDLKELGNNIRNVRISNHLSQEEMAKLIGVTQACINKYEKGKIMISIPVLYIFCKHFNISINDICRKKEEIAL